MQILEYISRSASLDEGMEEPRRRRWDRFDQDMGCCGDFSVLIGSSLVLTILSYLHHDLHALFRLRCVCKSWYDAVLSPQFIALRHSQLGMAAREEEGEPWAMVKARTEIPTSHINIDFGIFDHKLHYDYYDYNNRMESHVELWRPLSSSSSSKCSLPLGPPGSLFLGLGSSSNGLVCGRLMEDRDFLSLAVGNPLTGEWERLPPAPVDNIRPPEIVALLQGYPLDRLIRPPYMVFLLQADPPPPHGGGRSNYRLLAFQDSDDISLVVLYDSRKAAWEIMPGFKLEDASADAPASMLLEASAFGISRFQPATVAALTIDSTTSIMAWHYVDVSPPVVDDDDARFRQALRIFNHGGCCFLAGIFSSQNEDVESSREGFGVWELELEEQARWRLLSRVRAADVFGEGCIVHHDSDVKVQLCGGLVFFSAWYKRMTHGTWPPIAYDLRKSTWHPFTERTLLPYSSDVDLECSYVFVPSLAAGFS